MVIIELLETNKSIPKKAIEELREIIFEKKEIYKNKVEIEKAYYPYALSLLDYDNRKFTRTEKGK